MKKKRSIIAGMKQRFTAEGTQTLYDCMYGQAVDPSMSFENFCNFSARYLYTAVKPL